MTRAGVAPSVWALRGLVVVATLAGLLGGVAEGFTPSAVLVAVVALGAVLGAFRPDHLGFSLTLGIVVAWWGAQLHHQVPAGCLVAAAGIITAHVAATLLGYGPPWMPVPPSLLRLWAGRTVVVWLAAPAIWFVARAYADRDTPTSFWLAGLATALAGAVVAALAVPAPASESDG